MQFEHRSLSLQERKKVVFTAFSKHLFYARMIISKFVIEQDHVPLNPFMLFDYFLADGVERDKIRAGNNTVLQIADALWVFGPVSDGVLAEIIFAKKLGKEVKYFNVEGSTILEIPKASVQFEPDMEKHQIEM